jgi:hypothetical protein
LEEEKSVLKKCLGTWEGALVNEATTLENDENIRDFRDDFEKMVVAAVADDVPCFDL